MAENKGTMIIKEEWMTKEQLKDAYLKQLGFPDDFIVVKKNREDYINQIVDINKNKGFTNLDMIQSRAGEIWDTFDASKYDFAAAFNEAIIKYPKVRYRKYSPSRVFEKYYTVEKIGPLTYHCYLNILGTSAKKIIE